MKIDKKALYKVLALKIPFIIIIFVIFFPFIPVETQIQCFAPPCDPIVENKSIFTILIES